ncbi:MAG TPA: DUF5663 domain-containing protein [Candidatus Saccharimonadales bacterium]|nr:DUF5663 domain-containing protein [Candidatus Saccharimonadales bacterium]
MLKLDNSLLEEIGLGVLDADQKKAMLQHIYETLELRVGTNLANQMTDQQLEEFEKFIDEGGDASQAQALQWLEANLPHYKQVVNQVFEELKAEIRQMAPQIVASSMPAAGAPAQQQAQSVPAMQPGYNPHAFDVPQQQQGQGSFAGQSMQPQQSAAGFSQNSFGGAPAPTAPAQVAAPQGQYQSGYQAAAQPQQPTTIQPDDPYGFAMAANGAGTPPQQPSADPMAGYGQSAGTSPDPLAQYGQPGASTAPQGDQPQQSAQPFPQQQPPAGPGSGQQQYPY